jgi:hypothetical protein
MRTALVLVLLVMLAGPAAAGPVKEKLGSYNVSFDLNTTAKYSISSEGPSNGITDSGAKFTEYNLSIDGGDSLLYLVLRGYKINNMTDIDSNKTNINLVTGFLKAAQCTNTKLYQLPIDGNVGILGACSFPSNEVFACASYFMESQSSPIKKTNCRVFSTYPWEITKEMLYSLHVNEPG